ncbi:MAG: glutamyl-tRNA reductase [Campylobacteraceae bacterium]|jgi:glutamyl-tRNA reductase|nr:glutamyl-tRNA reductase [Campylobacteraceae bacterium]
MSYLIISFTHKNTNIDTREKLAFNNEMEKEIFLRNILQNDDISEAILVSTCNRVEVISTVDNISTATNKIIEQLASHSKLNIDDLKARANILDDENAIHHLFTVVSSLDSLVVGETQIIGQIKDAFKFSVSKDFCAQELARALHYSFKCAAKVRNITKLGSGSVSVASTAVSQAKKIFKYQDGIRALVIGAGEMSTLTIKHLLKYGFDVVLVSRDIKKAQVLSNDIQSEKEENKNRIDVRPYSELKSLLNSMRLMITATAAPYPIITQDMVENYPNERHWFDIAVPRDIDDIKYPNLNIYAVDDLQSIIDETMDQRASQAKTAYSIITTMRKEYFEWLKTLEVAPVVKNLHLKGESIINEKIENAIKKRFIKSDDQENIHKLCQTIMAEFLHEPSVNLRTLAKTMESDMMIGSIGSIFAINDENKKSKNNLQCEIPWNQ